MKINWVFWLTRLNWYCLGVATGTLITTFLWMAFLAYIAAHPELYN